MFCKVEVVAYYRMSETTLWTNPSPSAVFNAGEITLSDDFTNYSFVRITAKTRCNASTAKLEVIVTPSYLSAATFNSDNTPMIALIGYWAGSGQARRLVKMGGSVKKISFNSVTVGANATDNNFCVPIQVIGIK